MNGQRWRTVIGSLGLVFALVVGTVVPTQAQPGPAVTDYYHVDALGSLRNVTNEQGVVITRYDYAPFGDLNSPCTTSPDGRLFTGHERDRETCLDYLGARYYRSTDGRFLTLDPVLDGNAALVDPQRWNRYSYANNNPLKYVDPDGRAIETAWDVISLALSAKAVWQDPTSGWNWLSLGVDALSVLGPGIPAIGMAIRSGDRIDDAVKGARSAFEVASEGGRHAGFLRNYAGRSEGELRRGIASLEKEIAIHLDKIKDPEKYIEGFNRLDPRQQKALIDRKWPGDIQRQREQLEILKRLLQEPRTP